MLTQKEILEIREFLNSAASPLFYFDNDQDGLSSYLLLRRFIGRGKGIPIKTSPLDLNYFRRINEFNPDIVFILDQPTVSPEFFKALEESGQRVVWIDHHEIDLEEIPSWINYYNPLYNKTHENNPVTSLCYQITNRKEDSWIAIVGCIADKYIPNYYSEFLKDYPDLGIESDEAFEIFYDSQIGKISRMMGAGLKDRTTNVIAMIRFLISAKSPYEVLEEKKENRIMHKRFENIDSKFKKLISKAKEQATNEKLLFFQYSGEISMSADIANKLSYLYPDKYIIVAFIRGARVNLSIRGKNSREISAKAIREFPLATSGGHKDAVGAQLNFDEVSKFVENFKKLI